MECCEQLEYHQGNERFGMIGGTQCTSIAFIALLMSTIVPVSEWRPQQLHNIMHRGSNLHSSIVEDRLGSDLPSAYFMHSDLPNLVDHDGHLFETIFQLDEFTGVVGSHSRSFGWTVEGAFNGASLISSVTAKNPRPKVCSSHHCKDFW